MEIYIRYDAKTKVITFVHHQPFDPVHGLNMTRDELLKTGTFVQEYPLPERTVGTIATAYFNPETKKVYYKYSPAPLSTRERMDLVEAAVNVALMK